MPKKNNPGCKCCGPTTCLWTFHVLGGCDSSALGGSVVTLKQSGATIATCTVSAGSCQVDVPAGTYDITIDPPTGSGYSSYSGSLVHTCAQSTTITLTVASDHMCVTCTNCHNLPKTIYVTGTLHSASVSDTLIWDSVKTEWVGQNPQTDSGGHTYWLSLQCTTALTLYSGTAQSLIDNGAVYGGISASNTGDTCVPLSMSFSPNMNYPTTYLTFSG